MNSKLVVLFCFTHCKIKDGLLIFNVPSAKYYLHLWKWVKSNSSRNVVSDKLFYKLRELWTEYSESALKFIVKLLLWKALQCKCIYLKWALYKYFLPLSDRYREVSTHIRNQHQKDVKCIFLICLNIILLYNRNVISPSGEWTIHKAPI